MSPTIVIDVEGLGRPAVIVRKRAPQILILDAALDHERRMGILQAFMRQDASKEAE
jgi:hypothetical protein